MKITEIVVSCGRTFNHPFESFANFKPSITLKATVAGTEVFADVADTVKSLQAQADELLDDYRRRLIEKLTSEDNPC